MIQNEPKRQSRKAARTWRQSLDCGGWRPIFRSVVLQNCVLLRPSCAALESYATFAPRLPCGKPKRRQAAALQSLAALTRRSDVESEDVGPAVHHARLHRRMRIAAVPVRRMGTLAASDCQQALCLPINLDADVVRRAGFLRQKDQSKMAPVCSHCNDSMSPELLAEARLEFPDS